MHKSGGHKSGGEYRTLELILVKGKSAPVTVTIDGPCLLYTGAVVDYCSVNIICDDVNYNLSNRVNTMTVIPMEKPTIARGTTSTLLFAPYCSSEASVSLACLGVDILEMVNKLEWVSGLTIKAPSNGQHSYLGQLFAEKSLTITFDSEATDKSRFIIKKLIKI